MTHLTVVNDIHSRLNRSEVREIVEVASVEDVQEVVRRAGQAGLPVCIAGGRHAMGGQQFCAGGILIDTRGLDRVLEYDADQGRITVEAGIQWPALLAYLRETPWAIGQKQTGADRLSLGGAIAANAHGRGLTMPPLVSDLEELTLVDAAGERQRCSRSVNAELFSLVVGGYGLFGVIVSATLRLAPRRKLERVVEVRELTGLAEAFDERIAQGFLYGDFQFAIDPAMDDFLHRGVFSCYRPVDDSTPIPEGQKALSREEWAQLLFLTHTDKARAFELYAAHYLETSGQIYLSDAHQFGDYVDGYHAQLDVAMSAEHQGTEMITEIYVPRARLADFMADVAADFRATAVDVIYGTVRLIERDEDSFLAWAREPWSCVIFNLHTVHTPAGLAHSEASFRRLIGHAIVRGGSYFLTYHRWATAEQLEACYPRFREFLAHKLEHDPEERFQSDWYRHYRDAFA
ncbi:MAG: FAD-binding oxidoreductase [Actinobacteria bacterium]|nr:FAD-binding oxidoreductase [Actinomycetota bacterium]